MEWEIDRTEEWSVQMGDAMRVGMHYQRSKYELNVERSYVLAL